MTSNRPYLLRAFNDWILDNEMTPHIVVEADLPHVIVPPQTVKDGQVVLNISPTAVHMLEITNEQITFNARFGGVPFEVYIPMYAISAIYARENGAGTMFPPEEIEEPIDELDDKSIAPEENTGPSLTLTSDNSSVDRVADEQSEADTKSKAGSSDKDEKPKDNKAKRSHLSVVK